MSLRWFMTKTVLTLCRFVLASTQELHEKITELCSRTRDLEDALRTSHSSNSSGTHPLLSEELLRVKAPLQRDAPPRNPTTVHQEEEENNPDVIDSFGTLAISGAGHTSYHSQFANSWVRNQFCHTTYQCADVLLFQPPQYFLQVRQPPYVPIVW